MAEDTFVNTGEEIPEDENMLSSVQMLRSELAQEIISRKAGFLEKWSLLIFLGILLLVLGCTWFVHYPDVITTPAMLTAENTPKELVVKQEGLLIRLFVKNNAPVKQGDAIAWLENPAKHTEVNELANEVDKSIELLSANEPQKITTALDVNLNNLGELQSDYEQFLLAESSFSAYISNSANLAKVKSEHTPDKLKIAFQQQLQLLKNKINAWKNRYEVYAPINGKLSISGNIKENDYLKPGTLLGYIMPPNDKCFVETMLTQNNFGKIDTGLHVQIRLEAYPYEEWGYLSGTINYISNVPAGIGFPATIRLDNDLVTSNQKQIPFRSGLRAQAIIITKDMRLLQKFYYGFVKSTSVNK